MLFEHQVVILLCQVHHRAVVDHDHPQPMDDLKEQQGSLFRTPDPEDTRLLPLQ